MNTVEKIRICHLTSVHKRNDIRIFQKECKSLSGVFDTHLVVADGLGHTILQDITLHDAGQKQKSRLLRFLLTTRNVYRIARKINAALYHFHDPELIPVGLLLRWKGHNVIYDIHEDVPRDILSKDYLRFIKRPLSFIFERFENFSVRYMSGLVTATPYIRNRFSSKNPNTVDINNYPLLNELSDDHASDELRKHVVYIGALSRIRGLTELVKSLRYTPVKLELAGEFESDHFEQQLKALPEWSKVIYHGQVDRSSIKQILSRALAGAVTFYPEPNHIHAQPNKIFEYMSAGVPVVGSHFPLWKTILEQKNCGICVDPCDPAKIGEALNFLSENSDQITRMGREGKHAIETEFNWTIEEKKLIRFYQTILCR